jgi:hypothetical protein
MAPNALLSYDVHLLTSDTFEVSTSLTPAVSDQQLPGYAPLDVLLDLLRLPRGAYVVQHYLYDDEGGRHSAAISFSVVPEPGAVVLMLAAVVVGMSGRRRASDS